MDIKLFIVELALFGDAAAVTGTETASTTGNAEEITYEKVGESSEIGSDRREECKPKDLDTSTCDAPQIEADNGVEDAAQSAEKQNKSSAKDKRAEFDRLIKGEYRDAFTERTQKIIDRRFAETKGLREKLEVVTPILEALGEKYRISPEKLDELRDAIEKDDVFWSEAAEQAGLPVEKYKYVRRLERENESFHKRLIEDREKARVDETCKRWSAEARAVMEEYPEHDVCALFKDEKFRGLIMSGVDVKTAFEVLHMNDIKNSLAKSVEQSVLNNIRAKGSRPTENGVSSQGGVIVKSDMGKLTRKDREEMARRALRGEEIRF